MGLKAAAVAAEWVVAGVVVKRVELVGTVAAGPGVIVVAVLPEHLTCVLRMYVPHLFLMSRKRLPAQPATNVVKSRNSLHDNTASVWNMVLN